MKKTMFFILLTLYLLPALPALAQSPPPNLGGYQARPYIPPDAEPSIGPDSAALQRLDSSAPVISSRIGSRDPGLKSPQTRVRDREQTRANWRNEQRKISERSRPSVPQAPLRPGNPNIMGTPAPGQPSFPSNNR
jgi:hypothetical protein